MTQYVKEGSACFLAATFKDKGGNPVAPASARYRIDCLTTGQQVLDWTSIASPQAEHELVISAAQNAWIASEARAQRRQVTVEATYGPGDSVYDVFEYSIRNLRYVN